MKLSSRIAAAALAASFFLVAPAVAMAAATPATVSKPLVMKLQSGQFGPVLATRTNQALYYWTPEKKDFRIHCTGQCAKLWPPLIVPSGTSVPVRLPGFSGRFGRIKRPDGRMQLTYNRLPLYTYVHDGPGQVFCNNVDGWFVVRA